MSLINDMLRDLDARHARPAAGHATVLPASAAGRDDTRRRIILYSTAGAVLLLGALLALLFTGKAPAQARAQPTGTHVQTEKLSRATIETPAAVNHAHATSPQNTPATTETGATVETKATVGKERASLLHDKPATAEAAVTTGTDGSINTPPSGIKPQDKQPHIEITAHTLSEEQHVAQAFQRATRALAAERYSEAIQGLEAVLAADPDHHQARMLLASLYIRQQRNTAAGSLLAHGLERNPLHAPYARLLAHLLVTEERYDEAIRYLRSALPGATRDAAYQALLAGLYQRTGAADAAARHYSAALELSPDHGEWWMGLGISHEQAGNTGAARAAYSRALQYPLKTALRDFVDQQLQRLAARTPPHDGSGETQGKV